jgi:hypothetical protein
MTAPKMAVFAQEYNLQCVSQELITWETRFVLVDCLSTIVPRGSKWSRPNRVLKNDGFMLEAKRLFDLSRLYAWPSITDPDLQSHETLKEVDGLAGGAGAAI